MKFDFFKKKTKEPIYLEAEKSTILEQLDKKFKQHELIEQKIIERVNGLKNGQNKLADYITIQKLIDKQLMFLNELEEITAAHGNNDCQIPFIRVIIKWLKQLFKG